MSNRICTVCKNSPLPKRNKSGLCLSCWRAKFWNDPELRQRRLSALRKTMSTPEYRRKQRVAARVRDVIQKLDQPARKYYRQLVEQEGWSKGDAADLAVDDMQMRALENRGVSL